MGKSISFFFLIEGLIIYLLHPSTYSRYYIVLCGILFFLNIICFYKISKPKNYFDFNSIFFLTFFISTQYYPLFLIDTNLDRYFIFSSYSFDKNLVSQGSALSLLGLCCYISGSLLNIKKTNRASFNFKLSRKIKTLSTNTLYLLSLSSFLLFIMFGGYQRLINLYKGGKDLGEEVGLASYFFILCPAFLFVAITLDFIKIKNVHGQFKFKYFSKLGICITMLILVLILLTGSRTIPMQLVLITFGLYTYLFRPIGLVKFIGTMAVGIISLFAILIFRGAIEGNGLVLSDLFADLFGTNRAIYVSVEYTQKFGYTYGENMLGGLAAPIPFAQNFLISILGFDKDRIGSSLLYTKYTLGSTIELGLGTNIIADIYFSFGVIGVIILMFLLGRFIRRLLIFGNSNIYSLVAYAVMLSYSVFLVRAEYFTFLRFLIWSLIIMYVTLKFKRAL